MDKVGNSTGNRRNSTKAWRRAKAWHVGELPEASGKSSGAGMENKQRGEHDKGYASDAQTVWDQVMKALWT